MNKKMFEAHEVFGKHMFVRVSFDINYLPLGLCKCGCIRERRQGKWENLKFDKAEPTGIRETMRALKDIKMNKKIAQFIRFLYDRNEKRSEGLRHWIDIIGGN